MFVIDDDHNLFLSCRQLFTSGSELALGWGVPVEGVAGNVQRGVGETLERRFVASLTGDGVANRALPLDGV